MPNENGFCLEISEDDQDVAYLKLPGHPGSGPGVVQRTVNLRELIGQYLGPDISLDFAKDDKLIGIEIIG